MVPAILLTFEQAIQWGRGVIWIEFRETDGALPVEYNLEHVPFVRFRGAGRAEPPGAEYVEIEVRREYYGKTWRCWDRDPGARTDWKPWEE